MKQPKYINWVNVLFFVITPIVGIVGTVILAYKGEIAANTLWLALFLIIIGGISITAGYHRLIEEYRLKLYQASTK